jgi:hypothetical protein
LALSFRPMDTGSGMDTLFRLSKLPAGTQETT